MFVELLNFFLFACYRRARAGPTLLGVYTGILMIRQDPLSLALTGAKTELSKCPSYFSLLPQVRASC